MTEKNQHICTEIERITKIETKVETLSEVVPKLNETVIKLGETTSQLAQNTEKMGTAVSGLLKFQHEERGKDKQSEKMRSQNRWLIGLLVGSVLAIIGLILGTILK